MDAVCCDTVVLETRKHPDTMQCFGLFWAHFVLAETGWPMCNVSEVCVQSPECVCVWSIPRDSRVHTGVLVFSVSKKLETERLGLKHCVCDPTWSGIHCRTQSQPAPPSFLMSSKVIHALWEKWTDLDNRVVGDFIQTSSSRPRLSAKRSFFPLPPQ